MGIEDDIRLIKERLIVIENMLLKVMNKDSPKDRQDKEKKIKESLFSEEDKVEFDGDSS